VPTVATVATPPAPHDCRDGWLYSGPGLGCIIPLTEQKDLSSQEAEAACLDVGGYLVEPRSFNREAYLEEIAEVSNPDTVFTNCILSEPPPYRQSILSA